MERLYSQWHTIYAFANLSNVNTVLTSAMEIRTSSSIEANGLFLIELFKMLFHISYIFMKEITFLIEKPSWRGEQFRFEARKTIFQPTKYQYPMSPLLFFRLQIHHLFLEIGL